ncbi:hypothetical protein AADG42_13050 [Ammonicoccus fulvus]|uniref:Membrane protein YczE n=1 Tax=Ammonicoccus fulvus TaxID=3138240 RepID=A0ABZ3FR47_9ACTN
MRPRQFLRRGLSRRVELENMTPLEQLRAGSLVRRLVQLGVGLLLFGVSLALLLRAGLGLEPWGVLAYGVMNFLPLTYGVVSIVISFVVLFLWIPLKQWPGLATVLNAVIVGLAIDGTLAVVPDIKGLGWQLLALFGSVIGNGLAGALYIGSQLGPGPRDGLMVGLSRVTGRSIRLVRTSLEVAVVLVGWLLGGVVGIGTVIYAIGIGPVVQFFLPLVTVRVRRPAAVVESAPESGDPAAGDSDRA